MPQQSYTLEQLQQMGAKPRSYTLAELQELGAKPVEAPATPPPAGISAAQLRQQLPQVNQPLGSTPGEALLTGVDPHTLALRMGGFAGGALNTMFPGGDTPRPDGMPAMSPEEDIGSKLSLVAPIVGGLGSLAGALEKRIGLAQRMMGGANSARSAVADMSSGMPYSRTGAIVQAIKTGARPIVNAGAGQMEGLARQLAMTDRPPTFAVPPTTFQGTTFTPQAPPAPTAPFTYQSPVERMAAVLGRENRPPVIPERGPFPGESQAPLNIPRPQSPYQTLPEEGPSSPGGAFFDNMKPPARPAQEIPMANAPGVAGAVKPNIQQLREALAPSGMKAKQATIRLLPLEETGPLINEVPELAGLRKGPEFDQALVNGFRQKELGVSAAEEAVPRETTVPRQPIVDQLQTLQKEYAENPSFAASATKLEKMIDKWKEMPEQIPWEQFRDAKRAFFKEASTKSAPIRKAYGVLMDASSQADVTGNLAAANKSYSIVRRALDAGNFDIRSGERIGQVGKPAVLKGLAKVLAGQ